MNIDTNDTLKKLEEKGLLRSPRLVAHAAGRSVIVDGKEALELCSNDYLGLSTHPAMKEAAIAATAKYGTGAGASRLVSGTMAPHLQLETSIKEFMGAEDTLLFNSGWHANTGIIPALATRTTDIFTDRLDHASIIDGCLASRARIKRYPHADTERLEELLKGSSVASKLIITDGLFSMDGDLAPLGKLSDLAGRYDARLIIDDAHGIGTLGANGRGSTEELGLDIGELLANGTIVIGTFGKAFGSYGAFAIANKDTIKLLTNKARSFIYSTALPPAVCMASIKAIDIVRTEPERRARLRKNSLLMRELLDNYGLKIINADPAGNKGSSQIIPILIGKARKATEVAERLLHNGVFIQAIRPPTVAAGTARLRITVSSEHTGDELREAATLIQETISGQGH
ncbi:8-amino-7-oxononanoate synthase [hydrothermal vent metagenome]|uniref:8-amino-7-oxononanoate synthase n=1 Tax=hydrothermal vent metagenome TaxID=652676 RepID=A0A3B0RJW8_9ZZZZ